MKKVNHELSGDPHLSSIPMAIVLAFDVPVTLKAMEIPPLAPEAMSAGRWVKIKCQNRCSNNKTFFHGK